MTEKEKYLFYAERKLYTIKILNREEGHYGCLYQFVTDIEQKLCESSPSKILLKLIKTFNLYKEEFSEREINMIIEDLETISRKLKISNDYLKRILNYSTL